MSVCLSVCLSARISQKSQVQTSLNFLYRLKMSSQLGRSCVGSGLYSVLDLTYFCWGSKVGGLGTEVPHGSRDKAQVGVWGRSPPDAEAF